MTKNKSHVRVFVRTRPTARPYEGIKTSKDRQTITVAFPKQGDCLINNQLDSLTLKFDGVLENVSQDVVYETCVRETVDSALAGYNATVFAYGQTGAGKSHTMGGDARNFGHRGVIPRAIQHVFREADLRSDRIYSIAVSYLEVYNEALRDLLADDRASPAASDSLAILDDAATTVVRGLTKVPVASEEQALVQFFLGQQARSTAQHALNTASSRSHVLFTLHIEIRASAEADERALLSKLHLVDLAGSERIKKTQAAAGGGDTNQEQLRESACINKSLTFLEQVVNALARGNAHVPFRQCKLTAVLRDALGGNSNAVMLAALWPEELHLEECVSTLRFASRVRCLQTEARVNESGDLLLALRRAERQVRELRQELAMRDMLSGRGRVVYEDLTEGERLELQALALRFLAGSAELDELPTDSLKRIKETYRAFKAVSSSWAAAAGHCEGSKAANSSASNQGGAAEADTASVGDVDTTCSAGFCIGTAPLNARPTPSPVAGHAAGAGLTSRSSSPVPSGNLQQQQQALNQRRPPSQLASRPPTAAAAAAAPAAAAAQPDAGGTAAAAGAAAAGAAAAAAAGGAAPAADRNALFSRYKHAVAQGVKQAELVKQQQQLLAQLKQNIKDVGVEVNAAKLDIDACTEALEAKKRLAAASSGGSEGAGGAVLDDEHYQLLQQLKAVKTRYRGLYDGLADLRGSCDAATDALAEAKEALLAGFEAWLAQQQLQPQGAPGGAAAPAGSLGWSTQQAAAASADGSDDLDLDPDELYERADLAAKAAAAGDPSSAAFYAAAKKRTAHALAARRPM